MAGEKSRNLSDIAVRDEAKEVDRKQSRNSEIYLRFMFHGSSKRAENGADDRGSFAATEQSMSDMILSQRHALLRG